MGATALLYCECKFKIKFNNNDNACCDYKTKITLSVVTHTFYSVYGMAKNIV